MPLDAYVCLAHGAFDSFDGLCPHGCEKSLVRKKLAGPAILSDRTKGIDRHLRNLASDFNLTNMSNGKGYVGGNDDAAAKRNREMEEMFRPSWGTMERGAMKTDAVQHALAEHRAQPDNALGQVTDLLTNPVPIPVASFGSKADIKAE